MDQSEFIKIVEYEMKVIVSELGLKIKFRKDDEDCLNIFKTESAFRIFIVDYKNFIIATEVCEEMGLDYVTAAVYYAYLIALPSAEKQPSILKTFFTKKSELDIDYRNIAIKLHGYVMKRDSFGEFCDRWTKKVTQVNSTDIDRPFNLLSKNIEALLNQAQKNPLAHQIECLEVAINTQLGLYEQEENDVCISLFKTLHEIFKNCLNLEEAQLRLKALKFIEKSVDPSKTIKNQSSLNTILRLGVARKYLTHLEVLEYGILSINQDLIDSFKEIGIQLVEEPDSPDILF